MRFIDAGAVDAALSFPALVDVLQEAFAKGAVAPPRHHHSVALERQPEATLLLMPAWEASTPGAVTAGRYMGVKVVTVFPGNVAKGTPAVYGTYVLLSAETGAPLAIIDATRLTVWRTGAASALAARKLARQDARVLVMVGAGALAPMLVRAHASVRPIREVVLWNRSPSRLQGLADTLRADGFVVRLSDDLETAVRNADIVSTATLSEAPLVRGAWLRPGTHVDCVGAFKASMRETDDEVVMKARVFVDTREGALGEAGDIVQPLRSGAITQAAILGDLHELSRGSVAGRLSDTDITLFKSVGASLEDLAAAIAVYEA